MQRRGPLADSYAGAAALVVFSLVPFLALTAAVFPLATSISASLGLSKATLYLAVAMSTAGYAFGTVMAVQFASHLPPRRMLVLYETLFVVSSVLTAAAPNGGVFIGGFVTEGLCTSLMLIAAVPPLVTGWPTKKMPITGLVMNLCIFGAVAVGPTVGAVQAALGGWRPLFWGVAAVAVLALLFSLLTFEDQPAQDRSAPWDFVAIGLAASGCGAAFWGAGLLEGNLHVGVESLTLLVAGAALLVALVVYEYRAKRPLMPIKKLATTVPATGIVIALTASAASFGLMELVLLGLKTSATLTTTGLLFLPEFGAAVATAALFGMLFRTRYTPVLALSGLAVLVGSAALLVGVVTSGDALIAAGTGMVGLGVGASVSPALFMAGFSLRNTELQRVFAMIELLRGVTAFLVAPILVFLISALGPTKAAGLHWTIWICLGIAGIGGAAATGLFIFGQRGLQSPDLERWQQGEEPAWHSEPLLARFGGGAVGMAPAEHRAHAEAEAKARAEAEAQAGRRHSA